MHQCSIHWKPIMTQLWITKVFIPSYFHLTLPW
jgi:hypothetical protein